MDGCQGSSAPLSSVIGSRDDEREREKEKERDPLCVARIRGKPEEEEKEKDFMIVLPPVFPFRLLPTSPSLPLRCTVVYIFLREADMLRRDTL